MQSQTRRLQSQHSPRKLENLQTIRYHRYNTDTWCPTRNVPDFGRVFLMLKYTDIKPKHLCPKLNGYGDNGQRKVWSSGGSMHCTCQLTSLIDVCPWVWCQMTAHTSCKLHMCFLQGILECAVSHVMSVLAIQLSCTALGTLRTTMTWRVIFL
jgi:hypothetical protein